MTTTLSRTPAFNRSLQVDAADGGKLPSSLDANYDRADYFYWIALGWRNRTGLENIRVVETTPFQVDEGRERGGLIKDLASEALRHNPAEMQTRMLLARTLADLGEEEAALDAWLASLALAPRNAAMSYERLLFLRGFLSKPVGRNLAIARISPDMIEADLEVLRSGVAFSVSADAFSAAPEIAAFVGEPD